MRPRHYVNQVLWGKNLLSLEDQNVDFELYACMKIGPNITRLTHIQHLNKLKTYL